MSLEGTGTFQTGIVGREIFTMLICILFGAMLRYIFHKLGLLCTETEARQMRLELLRDLLDVPPRGQDQQNTGLVLFCGCRWPTAQGS